MLMEVTHVVLSTGTYYQQDSVGNNFTWIYSGWIICLMHCCCQQPKNLHFWVYTGRMNSNNTGLTKHLLASVELMYHSPNPQNSITVVVGRSSEPQLQLPAAL